VISDPFKGLYQDRWLGDVLHYTGMGPIGNQSITYAQNKTLAESPKTGIAVHLLEALEPQKYT
jgi:5-methylcytosine-specific restriction enzyme A